MGPPHVPSGLQVEPDGQQRLHPQSVCVGAQSGTHTPPEHASPHPHAGEHVLGAHTPSMQNSPPGHVPEGHVPPQPSGAPHAVVPPHEGAPSHEKSPATRSQMSPPLHVPRHVPPQPSGAPHAAPAGHIGAHSHA